MNSLCKDLYSALCCETKWMNLTIGIRIWRSFVWGLWTVKTPLEMLATDAKDAENRNRTNFLWGMEVLEAVCKAIDTKWGRIYFSTCEHFGQIICGICVNVVCITDLHNSYCWIHQQDSLNCPSFKLVKGFLLYWTSWLVAKLCAATEHLLFTCVVHYNHSVQASAHL